MLTLVLTRHGLTDRSDPEQHLGQGIDIGLSEAGRAQAVALAARIGGEHFDRIVSSPLRRARETAAAVAGNRLVEVDPRLAEMDYGRWEGLTYAELEVGDADFRRRWIADPATLGCPGGESGDDVATRARAFLDDALAWAAGMVGGARADADGADGADGADADRVILAVAHATLNRILLAVALRIPVREFRERFTQGQANITVLRWPGGATAADGRLLVLNDTSHLARSGQAPWELAPGA